VGYTSFFFFLFFPQRRITYKSHSNPLTNLMTQKCFTPKKSNTSDGCHHGRDPEVFLREEATGYNSWKAYSFFRSSFAYRISLLEVKGAKSLPRGIGVGRSRISSYVNVQLNSLDVSIINKGVPFNLAFPFFGFFKLIVRLSVALRLLHDESMRARERRVSRPLTITTTHGIDGPVPFTHTRYKAKYFSGCKSKRFAMFLCVYVHRSESLLIFPFKKSKKKRKIQDDETVRT
jgi:hypothetical protein